MFLEFCHQKAGGGGLEGVDWNSWGHVKCPAAPLVKGAENKVKGAAALGLTGGHELQNLNPTYR